MKKLIFILLVFTAISCTGFDSATTDRMEIETKGGWSIEIEKVTLEGHEYWIYDGGYNGGFCHSESCPCKDK